LFPNPILILSGVWIFGNEVHPGFSLHLRRKKGGTGPQGELVREEKMGQARRRGRSRESKGKRKRKKEKKMRGTKKERKAKREKLIWEFPNL
jgi:hypothetical protein